jgi:hypothetical protein
MKVAYVVLSVALLLIAASLAACGPTAAPEATATPVPPAAATTVPPADTATPEAAATAASYDDPFAYCAAVGTVDAPGADYTGSQAPESVALGLRQAMDAPDTPLEMLQNGLFWRCMDGQVYACFVGANLPCEARANTDRTPTQEETDFCQQNPDSDFIPAVVTGRETVYEWRCTEGTPEIVQQVFHADAQGFLSEFWYQISPGDSGGAAIQPLTVEVCNGQAQAMSHFLDDLIPTQWDEPLQDPVKNLEGMGCQATITGTGAQFQSPGDVVQTLGSMLEDQGWTEDAMLAADGPTGTSRGYRKGDQLCLAAAMWEPDAAANCPQDQPISSCEVTPEQQLYTVTLNCGVENE